MFLVANVYRHAYDNVNERNREIMTSYLMTSAITRVGVIFLTPSVMASNTPLTCILLMRAL